MSKNISTADFVVVCVTKRYLQEDVHTKNISDGLSEMINIEIGIALGLNKPVVAFVEEGTNAGSALPNITQYITLNGFQDDFELKQNLIVSLLDSACGIAVNNRRLEGLKTVGKLAVTSLAVYGLFGRND